MIPVLPVQQEKKQFVLGVVQGKMRVSVFPMVIKPTVTEAHVSPVHQMKQEFVLVLKQQRQLVLV